MVSVVVLQQGTPLCTKLGLRTMTSLKHLERKLGRFAIDNLTLYLVGGQGLALLLGLVNPEMFGNIVLIPEKVVAGQWWRLLSFVFTPPFGNPILAIFVLYLFYVMGGALESRWGTFHYNLYFLIGYLMTVVVAFAFPQGAATNTFITGSIFLAFAHLFPDFEILLFFVLPVRVKWLALLTWLFYGLGVLTGDWATRLLIMSSVTNFFLFFGKDIFYRARYGHRRVKTQASAIANRDKPVHVCTVCGITDKTHRNMDFRYCTQCAPPVAYCTNHLNDHQHVVKKGQAPTSDS